MSQHDPDAEPAEQQFRAAFERLKAGQPLTLKKGALVSQNNVAREAGRDPSALRKSRYPALIRDIQQWCEGHAVERPRSPTALTQASRRRNKELKLAEARQKIEYDAVASQLQAASAKILELSAEVESLRRQLGDEKVVPIDTKRRKAGR